MGSPGTNPLWILRTTVYPWNLNREGTPHLSVLLPVVPLSSPVRQGFLSQASLLSLIHLTENHQVWYSFSPVSTDRVGPCFYLIGVSCKYAAFFPNSLSNFRVESLPLPKTPSQNYKQDLKHKRDSRNFCAVRAGIRSASVFLITSRIIPPVALLIFENCEQVTMWRALRKSEYTKSWGYNNKLLSRVPLKLNDRC